MEHYTDNRISHVFLEDVSEGDNGRILEEAIFKGIMAKSCLYLKKDMGLSTEVKYILKA